MKKLSREAPCPWAASWPVVTTMMLRRFIWSLDKNCVPWACFKISEWHSFGQNALLYAKNCQEQMKCKSNCWLLFFFCLWFKWKVKFYSKNEYDCRHSSFCIFVCPAYYEILAHRPFKSYIFLFLQGFLNPKQINRWRFHVNGGTEIANQVPKNLSAS